MLVASTLPLPLRKVKRSGQRPQDVVGGTRVRLRVSERRWGGVKTISAPLPAYRLSMTSGGPPLTIASHVAPPAID
uniref:Uncharacterized protein n=1 Tax=Knipowitschia caucasica TaxID=637954 RepID=A0AAV2LXH7_KNICA